jgi:hypothetical protein
MNDFVMVYVFSGVVGKGMHGRLNCELKYSLNCMA